MLVSPRYTTDGHGKDDHINAVCMRCYFGTRATATRRSKAHLVADHLLVSSQIMPRHLRAQFSFIFSVFILPLCTFAANTFENTAIVRTVELGGALVHVTTTYAVKALEDGSNVYTIALAETEHAHTSWLEAKVKGQSERLPLEDFGYHQDR